MLRRFVLLIVAMLMVRGNAWSSDTPREGPCNLEVNIGPWRAFAQAGHCTSSCRCVGGIDLSTGRPWASCECFNGFGRSEYKVCDPPTLCLSPMIHPVEAPLELRIETSEPFFDLAAVLKDTVKDLGWEVKIDENLEKSGLYSTGPAFSAEGTFRTTIEEFVRQARTTVSFDDKEKVIYIPAQK